MPLTRSRLLLVAIVLAVGALWLATDNPEVDGGSRGASYTCLAPWDTVLNGADNMPGGEPPPDGDAIGARCRDAGQHRFTWSLGLGAAALGAAGAALGTRRRPRVPAST